MAKTPYDTDLDRNPANYQPLTPLGFLERAAARLSRATPPSSTGRCGALMRSSMRARGGSRSALAKRGIKRGDTVSVLLANTPAMLECHYGVPMCQAVLNTLNTRLDARDHRLLARPCRRQGASSSTANFPKSMKEALALCKVKPLVDRL